MSTALLPPCALATTDVYCHGDEVSLACDEDSDRILRIHEAHYGYQEGKTCDSFKGELTCEVPGVLDIVRER